MAEPKIVGNGDRFNRQVKATAAYADVMHEVQILHYRLFGDNDDGAIPQLTASMKRLEANPMIQLGYFLRSGGRALVALATFMALCATIAGGIAVVWARS